MFPLLMLSRCSRRTYVALSPPPRQIDRSLSVHRNPTRMRFDTSGFKHRALCFSVSLNRDRAWHSRMVCGKKRSSDLDPQGRVSANLGHNEPAHEMSSRRSLRGSQITPNRRHFPHPLHTSTSSPPLDCPQPGWWLRTRYRNSHQNRRHF